MSEEECACPCHHDYQFDCGGDCCKDAKVKNFLNENGIYCG